MNLIKTKLILIFVFCLIIFMSSFVYAQYNYDHVNVTTRVNVTNAFPEILQVLIDQDVTLVAGGSKIVYCNATIRDWNSFDDLSLVNATFYHSSSSHDAIDNGNSHYTNASCVESSNDGEYLANYTCSFQVLHYANNNSWTCNVTAQDTYGFTDNLSNTTLINSLYALNVTDVIDYGDLVVTDTSSDIEANITNIGNMDINVSVLGYGTTEGDGVGLVCALGGNISVENQRFSANSVVWDSKTPLSVTNQDMGLTVLQRTDVAPTTWTTYWQLYVPPNPQGECTGTIRFTATAS